MPLPQAALHDLPRRILSSARQIEALLLSRYQSRELPPDDEHLDRWLRDRLHDEIEAFALEDEQGCSPGFGIALRASILIEAQRIVGAADRILEGDPHGGVARLAEAFEWDDSAAAQLATALAVLTGLVPKVVPHMGYSRCPEASLCLQFLEEFPWTADRALPLLIMLAISAKSAAESGQNH